MKLIGKSLQKIFFLLERDGHNFLSFWTMFCPFTTLTTRKIKILEKWKKHVEISSFYKSVPIIMIMCYTVLGSWRRVTDVIFIFHFGLFFAFYSPNDAKLFKKIKKKKKKKNAWRYHHFTRVPKIRITWCTVPEIWCATDGRTDRRTDGRTEKSDI